MARGRGRESRRTAPFDDAQWLAVLLDSSPDGIVALDLEGTVVAWSRSATDLIGFTAEEAVGRPISDVILRAPPGAVVELLSSLAAGSRHEIETVLTHKEGRRVYVSAALAPITNAAGSVVGASAIVRDVTAVVMGDRQRKRAQQDIATQQQILEQIARGDNLHDVFADLCKEVEARYHDGLCSILLVDAGEKVLRDGAGPSIPSPLRDAVDGMPVAVGMGACGTSAARGVDVVITDMLTDPMAAPFVDLAVEHGLRSVWSHAIVDQRGQILGTIAVYTPAPHEPTAQQRRIVEGAGRLAGLAIQRKHFEDALQTAALVDPLTGLPNRNQFLQLLQRALDDPDPSVAVMFLDLDQFKSVNDTLGHPAGDRLLREASRRLKTVLRETDVLSRFGGDEFTVLLRGSEGWDPHLQATRLIDTFAEPFTLEDREFFISASVGVALGGPGALAFDLIRDADVAMYQAKARGPGQVAVFDEDLRTRTLARVTLDAELRRAFERHELVVDFQPIFELATNRCSGAEALVRWNHPTRGLLGPGEFVPLAEENGLVLRLGALVLDEVLSQVRRWAEVGLRVPVAVNVSAVELSNPSLVDEIAAALDRHGVTGERLLLEITETAVMEQIAGARATLEQVSALGVGVFIDDFGTGYSSISRLSDLPVMGLKIDRRFTAALGTDSSITKLTTAIIDLAKALDLEVIAEGIESEDALYELIALECTHGQGYLLGRPGGPDAIAALF